VDIPVHELIVHEKRHLTVEVMTLYLNNFQVLLDGNELTGTTTFTSPILSASEAV